jgi:hypothetical protein
MTRRRPAQPTKAARRRRKPGVHLAFAAPTLPAAVDLDIVTLGGGEAVASPAQIRGALARELVSDPLTRARDAFLDTVARVAPDVLVSLADVDDAAGLHVWARTWALDAPWILVVARNTLALWRAWPAARGHQWDRNHHDTGAQVIGPRGRRPRRPAEVLIRADHVEWLVRARVLHVPCREITTPQQTAQKAVTTLARRLGLSLVTRKSKKSE